MAIPTMKSSILPPFRAEDDSLTRRACQTNLTLDSGSRGHGALAKHRCHQCSDQLGSQLCPHNFGQTQRTGRRSYQTRGDKSSKEKCCDFLCQLPPETVCAMGVVPAEVNLTYHIQTLLKVFSRAKDSFERKEQMRQRGNSHYKTVIQKRPTSESQLVNREEILPITITHNSSGSHKTTDKAEKKANISNKTFVSSHSKPKESEDSVHENEHYNPTVDFSFLEDPAVPSCRDVSKGSPSDRRGCRREFFLPAFLLWVLALSLPCVALADPGRILQCTCLFYHRVHLLPRP